MSPFKTDYEVKAKVEYYLDNEDDEPVYAFRTSFNYEYMILKKDYFLLLDNGNGTDCFSEATMPVLDEPYCYFLHDLMDHSYIGDKIYGIDSIWVDVIFADQKGIKINEDGSS